MIFRKDIFLASASPRRLQLLEQVGIHPKIIFSEIDESQEGNLSAKALAQHLALRKTQAAANKVLDGVIIGADTVVALNERIYGKPKDFNQAVEMISSLSGHTHRVITGFAVLEQPEGIWIADAEETHVTFRVLSKNEVRSYVKWGESFDKAAGYGIQGKGALLVEKIEGDYFNVVGLPLQRLSKVLAKFQINLL
ncbi:Maf family protein [Dehalobacterium formicoaceticum]|uniref:Maf family protein n=1 Tax=Dehalobacterium formicoaceticum TaxID=51515 RepID=UPI000B7F289B|nr:Maf family protein [Dehalobacterium formicoaceticum]